MFIAEVEAIAIQIQARDDIDRITALQRRSMKTQALCSPSF
jgi:hypothetical protein